MVKEESLWHRIGTIQSKYIYMVLIVLIFIPIMMPLSLPILISPQTQAAYEAIENLPPGSVVLYDIQLTPAGLPAVGPACIAFCEHLFRLDVKILFTSWLEMGPGLLESAFLPNINTRGKVYGEDYINLGYIPGPESGRAAFASDISSVVTVDFMNERPLDEYEIMKDVKNANDIALIVAPTYGFSGEAVRQITIPYGVLIVTTASGGNIAGIVSNYQIGYVAGFLQGTFGIAEYENLLKIPGDATIQNDILSLTQLFAILLIIMANISYFNERRNV